LKGNRSMEGNVIGGKSNSPGHYDCSHMRVENVCLLVSLIVICVSKYDSTFIC